jgi:ribonuclease-3
MSIMPGYTLSIKSFIHALDLYTGYVIMIVEIQKKIDYQFIDVSLLRRALTHPSARHEKNLEEDNQRLEFLGDAVIGLLTAEFGHHEYKYMQEGQLTMLRSGAASTGALASIARSLTLGAYLDLGKGEENNGGRDRDNNLADALEAMMGACYLDGGLVAARRVFARLFQPMLERNSASVLHRNPKGELQELAQARGLPNPEYRVISEEGPAHRPTFVVQATLEEGRSALGEGNSKRAAEVLAADRLLEIMRQPTGSEGVS